jgi:hypothetical protein
MRLKGLTFWGGWGATAIGLVQYGSRKERKEIPYSN